MGSTRPSHHVEVTTLREGLYGVISQKMVLLITTAVRTSNPANPLCFWLSECQTMDEGEETINTKWFIFVLQLEVNLIARSQC
jgi:hypothetical protein